MSAAAIVGSLMLASALLYLLLSIAYAVGSYRALRELDDTMEIAKALGAYGALLRLEAEALGVPVEDLAEQDMRLAKYLDGGPA